MEYLVYMIFYMVVPTEICSPGTYISRSAWRVFPVGDVGIVDDYGVDYSYGYQYIIRMRFTARIISVLYMKGAIKYEIYQGHEITRYS